MKKVLFILLGALIALPAYARDFTYDYKGQTLNYTVLDETAKTVEIASNQRSLTGELKIPQKVTDGENVYKVISIGRTAFSDCPSMTSVSIPESVTSIGFYAFSGCQSLNKAEFASIESLCKIHIDNDQANPLRYAHHLYIDGICVTELVIPESVTSISNYAFYCCRSLTSVTILGSVTSIGNYTFYNCSGLTSVSILGSASLIGESAFSFCTNLTSVSISEGVTSIGNYAFEDCSRLMSISIPEGITSIGNYAFSGCTRIKSVSIPESVTSIGESAFLYCPGLTSVSIPKGITSIGDRAFSGCTGLESIYYPADKLIQGDANIFLEQTYEKATLYMTEDGVMLSSYKDPWKNFKNIKEYAPAGVEDICTDIDNNLPAEIYNLNGVKVTDGSTDAVGPGLYILKQGRKAEKIIVK